MSTQIGRNPNVVSVDEAMTATISSTCPGIILSIWISTSTRSRSTRVRTPRPVSKVTFMAEARSNGQKLCQKLVATVIAGSEAMPSLEPCPVTGAGMGAARQGFTGGRRTASS